MATKELVSEFEARRVERMLRGAWPGLLAVGEELRVLSGVLDSGWVAVTWQLADAERKNVYTVEVRVALGTPKQPGLREREAVELLYDFLAAQFEDMLRDERRPFSGPRWEEVDFAGHTLHLRGQMVDEQRENAASTLIDASAGIPPKVP
ncbi:MAG: hypothetical protein HY902_12160 [Deltaproteobacteria bacterium]|nr:hypothetical protein [Deltaproteobacteria bacterium]